MRIFPNGSGHPPRIMLLGGTSEIGLAILAALGAPADAEVIVVHDAARPLASAELWQSAIAAVRGGADGAVCAVPVSDTLKRVDGSRVLGTVEREGMVAVQTPQAFRAAALRAAHARAAEATDDGALVEEAGGCVVTVPGSATNVKITHPQDLVVAEALLREAT